MPRTGNTLRRGSQVARLVIQVVLCIHLAHCELRDLHVTEKTALQSTSHGSYPAGNAVDGDINTFSHTVVGPNGRNIDPHPTWQLDLDGKHCLGRITVTLRQDCCGLYRFISAIARAGINSTYSGNHPCGSPATRDQASTGATNEFTCDSPRMARYVSLDIDTSRPEVEYNQAYLQLAEVTVEEYVSGECVPIEDPTPKLQSANFIRLYKDGLIGNHSPRSTKVAKSFITCAGYCIKHTRCFSFDFAPGNKKCHLHDLNSTDIAVTPSDDFSIYVIK